VSALTGHRKTCGNEDVWVRVGSCVCDLCEDEDGVDVVNGTGYGARVRLYWAREECVGSCAKTRTSGALDRGTCDDCSERGAWGARMRSAAVWVLAKAWRGEKTGDGGRQFRGGASSACAQVAAKRVLCGGEHETCIDFLK